MKEWELNEDTPVSENGLFIDIRKRADECIKSTIVKQADTNVRIFVNGYAIICSISNLKTVLGVLNND